MQLDKKSLIQIVLLIVLVVGGAGVYFMQQDGGLDFISGLFESEPAQIRTPTPVARKPAPKPAPAPAPADAPTPPSAPTQTPTVKAAAPAIPATPVQGQVQGKPFTVESSSLEDGMLVLRHGQNAAATEIKISLPGTTWEIPAGKNFRVIESDTAAPPVTVSAGADGKPASAGQSFSKYSMVLEFGAEADKKLPGKIQLTLSDDQKSQVAGTFEAAVRGFRIINGKPDLSADSVETLQFLALRELLRDDPNKALEVLAFRDGRYSSTGSGSLEVEYRIAQGASKVQRFQFVKIGGAWKVTQAAKANAKSKSKSN